MNTKTTMRRRLLASTIICGALAASSAFAQAPASGSADVEAVIVTGSLLSRSSSEIASPVTIMTVESLQKAGISTATEAIRQVSADGAGTISTGFQSGFSAGGSAVSLRNLGVSSTLVLVDGLRSANFPISDDGHNAYVDLNSIPFGLIERVDVLKDGASSTYGADAIGGVVNMILKKRFVGVQGSLQGGASYKGDAEHSRADITVGFGDYAASGWNVFVNAEWQRDGRVSNNSRGFPYNTRDLSSIGGIDNNTADSSLTTATPNAVVARVSQSDLNNPRAGGIGAPLSPIYQSLNLNCANGTYTVTTGGSQGTGCKWNLEDQYFQLSPLQERYSFSGRLSFRVNDNIEAYATGSYSSDFVSIKNAPRSIRQNQPFGASPALSTVNPGVVLPVYICSAGINCATSADRRLNPNNPFAAAFANDPANGAARLYYQFGDVEAGSDRTNEVIRGTAGLNGSYEEYNWRVDLVGARDNLLIDQFGWANNAALMNAINTGSYNFVNPNLNTAAVRNAVLPKITTPSHSTLLSIDTSVSRTLMELPGGPMEVAVGFQARREELENNNQNARLDTNGLTTSSAFGRRTVLAGYFEIGAPVTEQINFNLSGRYDDYSEGFGAFSPKVAVTYEPIDMVQLRGTYSKGFRAPTFAESGPRSQFAGFSTFTSPASFQLAHGGLTTAGNTNGYAQAYSIGAGSAGNPDLEPEKSRAFTLGAVAKPTEWLTLTVDYYNVKKSNLIVSGPLGGAARTAYFSQTNVTAACAAVAAVGPGYSCNLIDAVDPLFPTALPRILIINTPFVNANYQLDTGLDLSASARWNLGDVAISSKVDFTKVLKSELHTDAGVQKYPGTLGPYNLSSGNGTPKYRGNWQTSAEYGKFSVSATAYYVGKIKMVSTDQGNLSTDCSANLYSAVPAIAEKFCYAKRFISVNANVGYDINDNLRVYADVGNLFNAHAPTAPASYASSPNFLNAFHMAGLIGRTYKVGVGFKY
jgi:iron complex outermembrane receptor protein